MPSLAGSTLDLLCRRVTEGTGARRTPIVPDLPTVEACGWPGFRTLAWGGLVVPGDAGGSGRTAQRRRERGAHPARPRLAARAFEVSPGTPQTLFEVAARERPFRADLVRRSGAEVE